MVVHLLTHIGFFIRIAINWTFHHTFPIKTKTLKTFFLLFTILITNLTITLIGEFVQIKVISTFSTLIHIRTKIIIIISIKKYLKKGFLIPFFTIFRTGVAGLGGTIKIMETGKTFTIRLVPITTGFTRGTIFRTSFTSFATYITIF